MEKHDSGRIPTRGRFWPLFCCFLLVICLCAAVYALYVLNAPKNDASLRASLDSVKAYNDDLARKRDWLQQIILLPPCDVKKALSQPAGAPVPSAAAPAASPATPADAALQPSPTTPEADKPTPASLAAQENATVFVICLRSDGKAATGSGFFVTPEIIVSNRHVVEGNPLKIFVINNQLKKLHSTSLVAASRQKGRDYAALRIDLAPGERVSPLPLSAAVRRADRINAWGFPSFITEDDPKMQRLLAGEGHSVPEVVYTDGVISVIQEGTPSILQHTAQISPGNSGGPLTNAQGHVVGINTAYIEDRGSRSKSYMALPASDIAMFLRENGITVPLLR